MYSIKMIKDNLESWQCDVDQNKIKYTWGQINGKMQVQECEVLAGKNIGKANETTKEEQALTEAKAKINKKIKEGYEIKENNFLFKLKEARDCPQPMLALDFYDREDKIDKKASYYVQPKLDGIRCLANTKTGKLYSRKGEEITTMPHISEAVLHFYENSNIEWLDGELFNKDFSFQTIMSIVRSNVNAHELSKFIEYHVYDHINETLNFEDRINQITLIPQILSSKYQNSPIHIVDTHKISYDNLSERLEYYEHLKYEGMMVRFNLPYETKRSSRLLKMKTFKQEEYLIIDAEKEKFDDTLGAFILGSDKGSFKARPALTDSERLAIWRDIDKYINNKTYWATVKYQELTEEGIPRFPVCVGIRYSGDM